MADVVNIHGEDRGPKALECPSCESMRFFLFPDNIAQCVECTASWEICMFGTIYLSPSRAK